MPPNTGEICFEDLESTFDLRTLDSKLSTPLQQSSEGFNFCDWDDNVVANGINAEDEKEDCQSAECRAESDNYWKWSSRNESSIAPDVSEEVDKEGFIERILLEEEIRKCLMVDRIEKRLVEDEKRRKCEIVECSDVNDCHGEESERYWYWGGGDIIRGDVRLDLKVNSIEKVLLADADNRNGVRNGASCDNVNGSGVRVSNYWDWEEEDAVTNGECLKKVNKEELLDRIVLEEKIRRRLMVENVEKCLLREARIQEQEVKECERIVNVSDCDDCWSW
mmetsp:Transcript_62262/g.73755  ORF Transcript_62262/g.73755 Transcript_62262/m.73755 type:complete len:278 (+) Transcript_62262:335-1168(+)